MLQVLGTGYLVGKELLKLKRGLGVVGLGVVGYASDCATQNQPVATG